MIIADLIIIAVFVSATYIFGLLYAKAADLNRKAIMQNFGWTGFCLSAVIGTPFHELSHLIMAWLFDHQITEFALYRPIASQQDGQLGYVNHTYKKMSLYQNVGNFFIGAAPMLFGAGLLTFLFSIAAPNQFVIPEDIPADPREMILLSLKLALGQLVAFFDFNNYNTMFLWIFLAAAFICPHLGMSGADFKNTISGTIFLFFLGIIIPFIIKGKVGYARIYLAMANITTGYISVLIIGLAISFAIFGLNKLLYILRVKAATFQPKDSAKKDVAKKG